MPLGAQKATLLGAAGSGGAGFQAWGGLIHDWVSTCLLYTSDAADE